MVSGVASLIKAVRPELTADQIHQLLTSTTDNIEASLKPSEKGKMGTGRLNALKAVQAALALNQVTMSTGSSTPEVVATPATSTEETPAATSFYFTSPTASLRWLVAPKPLWSAWSLEKGHPVATAFVKEGQTYFLKRWFTATNQELVLTITPPKGQTWTQLSTATGTSPAWLLLSTKRELRLVNPATWKVTTIPAIKGLPASAKLSWDAKRDRFAFTALGTKKVWEIDRAGRVTTR